MKRVLKAAVGATRVATPTVIATRAVKEAAEHDLHVHRHASCDGS